MSYCTSRGYTLRSSSHVWLSSLSRSASSASNAVKGEDSHIHPLTHQKGCTLGSRLRGVLEKHPYHLFKEVDYLIPNVSEKGCLCATLSLAHLTFGVKRSKPTRFQLCVLVSSGMRKSPEVSPRRLSDISPQLRQLKYLVVDESIKEDLKSSRSVEDINSASIEERILRITGYYGYQPWNAVYKSKQLVFTNRCIVVMNNCEPSNCSQR